MTQETVELTEEMVVKPAARLTWQHRAALESIKMLSGIFGGYIIMTGVFIICDGICRSYHQAGHAVAMFAESYGIELWDTTIPVIDLGESETKPDQSAIKKLANIAGKKHKVDPDLILAVARTESSERPFASNDGALGLMQLRPATRKYFGISDAEALDPHISIDRGAEWLAIKMQEQNEDVEEAVQSYYCGTSRKTCIGRPRGKSYLAKVAQNYVDIKAENRGDV